MKEQYDEKKGYCRMLGHTLAFRYCRTMNEGLPCHNVLNCWYERIDVEEYIAENYSKEQQRTIFEPPQTKMARLSEILNKLNKEDR